MDRTELLAPGGNLDSAMAALENGADAVYCGLQEFSARKGAKNFSMEQLGRLRQWTLEEGRKVYVAINTILKEEELPRVASLLGRLEEMGVDSIILQDPGLIRMIRRHFPGLTIHASTQMAVHNIQGLRMMEELGVSRVVLPRELTLKEMEEFRRALPQMELEVFIHGAQCYGFSGMCLASGMLLGRSANRGECGQICRTWFRRGEETGYYLSSTDLWAGEKVLDLQKMGIASLKIEGRMKSPAYAAAVSRYYRRLLDGAGAEELKGLEENLRVAFARKGGTGHLGSVKGRSMVDPEYPGHRGLPLGTVEKGRGRRITLSTPVSLHRRDGLMFLDARGEARSFSLQPDKDRIGPGRVSFSLPFNAPPAGTMIYKVQSHDFHSRLRKEEQYPPFKRDIEVEIALSPEEMRIDCAELNWSGAFSLATEISRSRGPEERIRKEFAKCGEFQIRLIPAAIRGEGCELESLFIPPSALKALRKQAYAALTQGLEDRREAKQREVEAALEKDRGAALALPKTELPLRSNLNPEGTPLPFLFPGGKGSPTLLEGKKCYPLPPLLLPDHPAAAAHSRNTNILPEGDALIGIGNWGHIPLFRTWKKERENLSWFGDTGFLLANSQALLLIRELTGDAFRGAYGWLEAPEGDLPSCFSSVGPDFRPPLFISRNCFRKHSLKESCRDCGRSHDYRMEQNGREYEVYVRDCLTWVLASEPGRTEELPPKG